MAKARIKGALWGLLLGALAFFCASGFVGLRYQGRIHQLPEVPSAPVALVFGAGLSGKEPSKVLAERLDRALALYQAGKVKKILVSGDNSERWHDETGAMRRYLEAKGVPRAALLSDAAGYSTYDSCYRALGLFGVRRALLVTQRFHLPRALFIANSLGMDAWGVAADDKAFWELEPREVFSQALALGMVILRPEPRELGSRKPID